MSQDVTAARVRGLMKALGRRSTSPGRIYLVGGATAVLVGWRTSTVDVDVRMDPEPGGIFVAIRDLKDELDINIELASPQDFLPPLPGWEARSIFVAREGAVDFFHYDLYSQALAKIERGHGRDLADVAAMVDAGLVDPARLRAHLESVWDELLRYPAVDPDALRAKVTAFVESRA